MSENMTKFAKTAKDLSRNPLGIIALFIVLVYGFACLLFGFSASTLKEAERLPIIWFVVCFPVVVLALFGWLVSRHHDKLYGPGDYRDDKSFLETLRYGNQLLKRPVDQIQNNIKDLLEYGKDFEIISDQEKRIESDLVARNLEVEGNTVKVLIRHLAATQVFNWFEQIYKTIFGSQIVLLQSLLESPEGIETKELSIYYENIKKMHEDAFESWNLSMYLRYILESGLIAPQNNNHVITKKGSEFLKLLTASGYSEIKGL